MKGRHPGTGARPATRRLQPSGGKLRARRLEAQVNRINGTVRLCAFFCAPISTLGKMTITEKKQRRAAIVRELRQVHEAAEAENRDMNADDETKWQNLHAENARLKTEIDRDERLKALELDLGTVDTAPPPAEPTEAEGRKTGPRATPEYRAAFNRFLIDGMQGITDIERRALQTDNDPQAGYLVPPEQFVAELIKTLDDTVYIRQLARKFMVPQAKSLGAPRRTTKMSTWAWGAEIQAPTADTAYAVGKRNLYPHYLSGSAIVSEDLLRSSIMGADEIVLEEMSTDAGEVQEDAFLTGSGSQRPLGVFTASTDGISTGRDVSTGNTTTAITFDGLLEAKYSLKKGHRNTGRWLMHRDTVKMIDKLVDGEGQYIWRVSTREGEPDRLLGLPFDESERAPNTFTAGLYVGILANWQHYWIADSLDMEIKRLVELRALTNEIQYLGRLKTDAMPVLEEAFSRVTLAP